MKKIIAIMVLILGTGLLEGQNRTPFVNNYSVTAFGGGWVVQKNTNYNGQYGGVFGNIFHRLRNSNSSIGLYGSYARSGYSDNLSRYSASTDEWELGVTFGTYKPKIIRSYSSWAEISLGLDYSNEKGENHSIKGKYLSNQRDIGLLIGVNANLFKDDLASATWLTRSQVEINWRKNINSKREATWEGIATNDPSWDNSYLRIIARQNIISYPGGKNLYLSPKLMLGYEYQYGDKNNFYSIGLGIGLHKKSQDDWLKIEWWYKNEYKTNNGLFLLGISLNFSMI